MGKALLIAGLLCSAVRAQDRAVPRPPKEQKTEAQKPPLSREDAELVKQLAVLEQLELLRNLDLFEQDKDAKQANDERPQ